MAQEGGQTGVESSEADGRRCPGAGPQSEIRSGRKSEEEGRGAFVEPGEVEEELALGKE